MIEKFRKKYKETTNNKYAAKKAALIIDITNIMRLYSALFPQKIDQEFVAFHEKIKELISDSNKKTSYGATIITNNLFLKKEMSSNYVYCRFIHEDCCKNLIKTIDVVFPSKNGHKIAVSEAMPSQ